jgi:hypothetical protein
LIFETCAFAKGLRRDKGAPRQSLKKKALFAFAS